MEYKERLRVLGLKNLENRRKEETCYKSIIISRFRKGGTGNENYGRKRVFQYKT